jgi:pimeloyl-ACP methyl ester carboxylesterase
MTTYRSDLQRAWDRINSVAAGRLQASFGTIQYAETGEGLPLLVSHGVLGCHVDGVDGWWSTLWGPGFRIIAPARFGYFDSTLPPGATPADQADAYALLLDHLEVERAVVAGFSAGSGSILEFGLRHPDRTVALILANCRLGGGVTTSRTLIPLFRLAYRADGLFWLFKRLLPAAYSRMMGAPKGYRPTAEDAQVLKGIRELLFPLKPRRNGAVFDGFVSNLAADRFPLEELKVPTLVISAKDDPLAPHRFAVQAAARIPGARFVAIDGGGHLLLGHDAEVRREVSGFVASVLENPAR